MEKEIRCPRCGSKNIRKYNEDCVAYNGGEVRSDDCMVRCCLEPKCDYKWREGNIDKEPIPTITEKSVQNVGNLMYWQQVLFKLGPL